MAAVGQSWRRLHAWWWPRSWAASFTSPPVSWSIRHDISFGFEAEPYSPEVRRRALHQHPELAQAVIEGNPGHAAELAADHFSLTESMLRELHARVMLRGPAQPQAAQPKAAQPQE